MAYRPDPDLEFLSTVPSEDLAPLVDILCGPANDRRFNEWLTGSEAYKTHAPDHQRYWEGIAHELQRYGGNTFSNWYRGTGVPYREALLDVCDKMKVNFNAKQDTETLELALLMKVLEASLEKMSEEDLRQTVADLGLKTQNFTKQGVLAALQIGMRAGGFLTYRVAVIVANAVVRAVIGRGLTIAGNAAITRVLGVFLGPIGWAITTFWTAYDLSGPAYRVTIPACVYVAFLRQKMKGAADGAADQVVALPAAA